MTKGETVGLPKNADTDVTVAATELSVGPCGATRQSTNPLSGSDPFYEKQNQFIFGPHPDGINLIGFACSQIGSMPKLLREDSQRRRGSLGSTEGIVMMRLLFAC